jgi:hypothetical protein
MTPLEELRRAEQAFADGEKLYYFKIPPGKSWVNYKKRISELARARGYTWTISHTDGREWVIRQKVIK